MCTSVCFVLVESCHLIPLLYQPCQQVGIVGSAQDVWESWLTVLPLYPLGHLLAPTGATSLCQV